MKATKREMAEAIVRALYRVPTTTGRVQARHVASLMRRKVADLEYDYACALKILARTS